MAKILLIDDDTQIQSTYAKFLKDEGHDVHQAQNAQQATWLLIRNPVDLVLLDINMPGIDGVAMREVLAEYDDHLKIVVSSVLPLTEQRRKIARVSAYFDKSHGIETLTRIIETLLRDVPNEKPKGGETP